MPAATDAAFSGAIAEFYEQYLVPVIFEPYASDLAARVAQCAPAQVLELAAGTGAVTRHLARLLPADTQIVATDLNQAMLDKAIQVGTARPVQWRQADAMQLPFPDASFDALVCQFGVMFFPDKAEAHAQARRVLRPGGWYFFNVWDRIETNEFSDTVARAVAQLFPGDPPSFMARVPHGYHNPEVIRADLARGGFDQPPEIVTVTARCRVDSPQTMATAICQGTPLRSEIEARDPALLTRATDAAAAAVTQRFGEGPIESQIQALVIAVQA